MHKDIQIFNGKGIKDVVDSTEHPRHQLQPIRALQLWKPLAGIYLLAQLMDLSNRIAYRMDVVNIAEDDLALFVVVRGVLVAAAHHFVGYCCEVGAGVVYHKFARLVLVRTQSSYLW